MHRGAPGSELRRTRWSLHADLSGRTLELRRDGRRVHRLTVAIGRPGSETPTGRFAVTDKLRGSHFGPYYGCCILALSGRQPNTPPGWTGRQPPGDPRHGLAVDDRHAPPPRAACAPATPSSRC